MDQSERRMFVRYALDLPVTVAILEPSGNSLRETTTLHDASGGGLRFITRHADWYIPGQDIEISVELPQSGNISAHMSAHGRVMRTIEADNLRSGDFEVAIILVTPLRFERSI
uniref:PilZ domain-containing protein n=1 Tax=Candidatus Desulfatibia profunda TaxID=2841695 RepID=A0A8J6TNK9_9BACT|nr:PilZ domain-containing protein [Candidatus Desulfatibia profunda]